ncbi:glycosyl transferase [Paenibacillus sp. J31TS4]|uniref:glycosyltransferase n=1 Tax=Paenibacillus sp. J31TS4 TaxID=2807195 RepID=UPI001B1B5E48|nr:glycosyltransferase [Paenibacillus sp. J31TS4]GIP39894.1 glycosyl transferase [Paenibacillus sp. J31TS4]
MRGYYLVSISKEIMHKKYEGVAKKIHSQIEIFNGESLYTKLYCYESKNSFLFKVARHLPFNSFVFEKKYNSEFNGSDFIYIRKMAFDIDFILLLKNIKKNNPRIKVVIELPTYPYDKERSRRIIYFASNIKDAFYKHKLKKYVDRIVTFSNDDIIFGIPAIKLSNGIDCNRITSKKPSDAKEIHVIAVAMLSFWHGYDRFIEGLGLYYKSGGKRDVVLHIVGDGDVINFYKNKVHEYGLQDKVFFHGKLYGPSLDELYDLCEIGLDAMGRHRSGVYYNSSLKGKEYLAKGLPIVSGVETELDYIKDFKYYMRVSADDSPINIKEIISFYDSVYVGNSKNKVISEIRRYAEKNFDQKVCMQPLVKYLSSGN